MNTLLVILLVAAVIATVISLVRGIVAFLQSTKLDLESGDDRVQHLQERQNKMMFNRIKFQALAVVIVAVLLMMNR